MEEPGKQVVVVTGAGQGIGRAISLRFARDGKIIAIADINSSRAELVAMEICQSGGLAKAYPVDVSSYVQVQLMVDEVLKDFSRIDILVNNAGIFNAVPFYYMTEEQWDQMLNVILKGTYLCSRAVVNHMLERRSGCIVNIASTSGISGGTSGAHYAAAKGGVIAFTKALGKELAGLGVRVNAVAPSKIDTDMLQDKTPELRQELIKKIPLGRVGKPEEIAEIVSFLTSDGAAYIVGEVIVASGGY